MKEELSLVGSGGEVDSRFQPEIISELVGLVKRPLDIHFSGDRLNFSATQKYRSCAVVEPRDPH